MLLALVLSSSALSATSQDAPKGPEPRACSSPSGRWSLTISTLDENWNGAAEFVMQRDSVEVWRERHELGVRQVVVSDEGHVAGFGYTGEGARDGLVQSPQFGYPMGAVLRVFVRTPEGALVLDEAHPRKPSAYPDGHSTPVASACFLHPELGRFVVRVPDEDLSRGAEEWWAYDLATGAVHFRERPRPKLGLDVTLRSVLDARPVPGTPLVLVHWTRFADADGRRAHGMDFTLVAPEWTVLWSHELRYEPKPGEDYLQMVVRGADLAHRSFEIPVAPGGKRGQFEVRPDGTAWSVTEVAHK